MEEKNIQEFEKLKKEIENLRVKRLSDEREKEKLEKELEDLKLKIKEIYGVEIEDFEKAIADLQTEFDKNYEELKLQLQECKSKLEME